MGALDTIYCNGQLRSVLLMGGYRQGMVGWRAVSASRSRATTADRIHTERCVVVLVEFVDVGTHCLYPEVNMTGSLL